MGSAACSDAGSFMMFMRFVARRLVAPLLILSLSAAAARHAHARHARHGGDDGASQASSAAESRNAAEQKPTRVRGQVVDGRTGQPLARVRVEIVSTAVKPTPAGAAPSGAPDLATDRTDPTRRTSEARTVLTPERNGGLPPPVVATPPVDPVPRGGTRARNGRPPRATTRVIVTDADGRFDVDAPPGTAVLTVSVVGYLRTTRDVAVASHETTDLTIPLTEGTGSYTESVRVTGERFPRTETGVPTEQTLGSADLQNLKSTLADDPMRAVQSLPGVASSDDFKSEFSIRGSDFRHVNVTLDGVPSPLLLHTVHGVTDSGSLAMINSDILDSVTLLGGSYPQRYGDRTGGSVEFRTREGSRDRPHVRLTASAINVSGVAEGPVGRARKGSWLVSARKSYLDWLVRRIDPNVTGTFAFVDAHAKVGYDVTPSQSFHANVVMGRSAFHERETEYGFNSLDVGRNRAVLINTSLRSTVSPSFIVTQRLYGVAGRFRNLNPWGMEIGSGDDRELSYRVETTTALRGGLLLESGGHLQWLHGDGLERTFDENGRPFERPFRGSATRQAAYAHLRWQARPFLTISPGARVDRWDITGQTQVSPWLQAEVGLPRSFLLAAGTGVHRQAPTFEQVVGPRGAPDAVVERAFHADVGIGQRIGAWRWQAIAFLREERDVQRLPDSEPRVAAGRLVAVNFDTRWENALRGRSRGAELFLHRRTTNGLSGWIGYAYASTRYRDPVRGETFVSDVDQRHTLNLYGSYRLNDRTNIAGRFRVGSNGPLVGYYREDAGRFFLSDARNALRLPTYSRLDLRATRTYDVPGGRFTLFAEVINLYNRRNVRARSARIAPSSRRFEAFNVNEEMFPIIPSLGMTVEF